MTSITDAMRKEAIIHTYEKIQDNVNSNSNIPNVLQNTDINVSLLQQAVFVEGVRPRQTYVYRPGSTDTGPVVFGEFDELYKMASPNINSNILTTVIMDDTLKQIVFNKQYNMKLFVLQGYKYNDLTHVKVSIGPTGQLVNLSGLNGIDLFLDNSMTHTSLLYTATNAPMTQHSLTMEFAHLKGLTTAIITANSPCIDVEANVFLQIILKLKSIVPTIPRMIHIVNSNITIDGQAYIRLNGGSILNVYVGFNASIHKSVCYASVGLNNVFISCDSTTEFVVPHLSYPTNINFRSNVLAKAANSFYAQSSAIVPSPFITGVVTIKEQMDAMNSLQVDNTSLPFNTLNVSGAASSANINATDIGFYGATPIAQQMPSGNTTLNAVGSSNPIYSDTTFGSGWTITDVVNALQSIGLLGNP